MTGAGATATPPTAPAGVAPAIRLRAPRDGETVVDDLVQGAVRVANAEMDDMIILRSDGTPTYLHAVVWTTTTWRSATSSAATIT